VSIKWSDGVKMGEQQGVTTGSLRLETQLKGFHMSGQATRLNTPKKKKKRDEC
jgi:hypothetical protein